MQGPWWIYWTAWVQITQRPAKDVSEDPFLSEDWPCIPRTFSFFLCSMGIIEPTSESWYEIKWYCIRCKQQCSACSKCVVSGVLLFLLYWYIFRRERQMSDNPVLRCPAVCLGWFSLDTPNRIPFFPVLTPPGLSLHPTTIPHLSLCVTDKPSGLGCAWGKCSDPISLRVPFLNPLWPNLCYFQTGCSLLHKCVAAFQVPTQVTHLN